MNNKDRLLTERFKQGTLSFELKVNAVTLAITAKKRIANCMISDDNSYKDE
jgi:hypothetical protein